MLLFHLNEFLDKNGLLEQCVTHLNYSFIALHCHNIKIQIYNTKDVIIIFFSKYEQKRFYATVFKEKRPKLILPPITG